MDNEDLINKLKIYEDENETSKIVRAISKNVYLDNETKQQYLT